MEAKRVEREKVRLLFIGSPLLDITARCDRSTLDAYGLKADDCVRETERHGELFRTLLADPNSRLTAGGSSQNSARIAKWTMGQKAEVSFAGCVGQDEFAATMESRLRSEGVEPLYVPLAGESTGICACLLLGDMRSMCTRLGAAEKFGALQLREVESIRQRALSADVVHVEGYFLDHSPDVLRGLVRNGRQDLLLSVSLAAEYICRDHQSTLEEILPRVNVLFSNEAEAKVLGESLGLGDTRAEDVARYLASATAGDSRRHRVVVVTRGPLPVIVAVGGGAKDEPQPQLFHLPVPSISVLDAVGCGDALAGAFLAVYCLTGDVREAGRAGIEAAAAIAQVAGCNPPPKEDPKNREVTSDGNEHAPY